MRITHGQYCRELSVPYDAKIADITHADTTVHYLNLATALTETRNIISIILGSIRITGTGYIRPYPNEGSNHSNLSGSASLSSGAPIILASKTNRLMYSINVANDDFDLFCFGYSVEITA